MANTSSAKKAIRVSERKRIINLRKNRQYKEDKKAVFKAITNKDKSTAEKLLPSAFKSIDKAAKGKVIHKNTAARYKSQLSRLIKGI
jgi:small subunit ribosomal protein S20